MTSENTDSGALVWRWRGLEQWVMLTHPNGKTEQLVTRDGRCWFPGGTVLPAGAELWAFEQR